MRILTVVGARPQFVKAAAVSGELRRRADEILLHTGQHADDALSGAIFRGLAIPEPEIRLPATAGAPGPRLAAMIRGIRGAIRDVRPARVLVYGDTDSTLAGALASREEDVPLVHVEAGMRSGDPYQPEEANRIAADHLASLLLTASESAGRTLRAERVRGRVEFAGDVMLDVVLAAAPRARALAVPERLGLAPGAYFLATVHRAENTDDAARLTAIAEALAALPLPAVFPCHPRTRSALRALGLDTDRGNLRLLPPLPYEELLSLTVSARAVLTDSGGLQREAVWLGVPCVTLRDRTEWTETVEGGWNRLAGADPATIAAAAAAPRPAAPPDLRTSGGGRAAETVARLVSEAPP